jgi:hypothetical protein
MDEDQFNLTEGLMAAHTQRALDILEELDSKGVRLTRLADGKLLARPASLLSNSDRDLIRAYRSALVPLLLMRDLRETP